jgi:hypothetical protein
MTFIPKELKDRSTEELLNSVRNSIWTPAALEAIIDEVLRRLQVDADIENRAHELVFENETPEFAMQELQIRASLLQAAQLKRIADALDAIHHGLNKAKTEIRIEDPFAKSMLDLLKEKK